MLGIPTAGAGAWTLWSFATLCFTMLIMLVSGCLILEALQHYPYKSSYSTVTKDLLGPVVNAFNNTMIYFVGGILLYAYITSSGQIIGQYFALPSSTASIAFVLVFSAFVWHSTQWVDRISVCLMLFMALSFVFGILGLTQSLQPQTLWGDVTFEQGQFVWALFPIAIASFGYHHTVSTLRDYYLDERLAQKTILGGIGIALLAYTVWLVCVYGNLPQADFHHVIAEGGNVDVLLAALSSAIHNEHTMILLNAFSMAAILSSFIGVGLGVFDFLADAFKCSNSTSGRSKTWALTFIPPLLMSLLFPFGFLKAIGLAAAAAAIWACITPVFLVRETRKKHSGSSEQYRVPGGNWMLATVFVFGVGIIIINALVLLDALPRF